MSSYCLIVGEISLSVAVLQVIHKFTTVKVSSCISRSFSDSPSASAASEWILFCIR
jgi:hypothetical protein